MTVKNGINRRGFLTAASGGALAVSQLLAGCARTVAAPTLQRGEGSLRILNWPTYIDTGDDGTEARFQQLTRVSVAYSELFTDNNEVYDKLAPVLASGQVPDYDIICPTFWLAARLINKGWAEPLPLDVIPNHLNLDPAFLRQPFDRGALYNLPWQSGITGIAYNTKLTSPVRTINDLLNRADLKGRVGFFSEMRDSIGLAMLSLGKDPSRATQRDAKAALDVLADKQKSGHIVKFANNEQYLDALRSGDFAACVAWSGDIVQLKQDLPNIEFAIPEEGGMQWFDTMIIPKRASFGGAAARWMDFVYDPTNAARITASVKFISPVLGVRDALTQLGPDAAKLSDDPLLFPNAETRRRLSTWNGTTVAEEDALAVEFSTLVEA
jgi:spermidine/putrescine transport system substrate-binding protein